MDWTLFSPSKMRLAGAMAVFLMMPAYFYSQTICAIRGDVGMCGWQFTYFLAGIFNLLSVFNVFWYSSMMNIGMIVQTLFSAILNFSIAYLIVCLVIAAFSKKKGKKK